MDGTIDKAKEKKIIDLIAAISYDCYGLIDVRTHELHYYFISQVTKAFITDEQRTYEDAYAYSAERLRGGLNVNKLERQFELSNIIGALEKTAFHSITYPQDNAVKSISFRYLDGEKQDILFTIRDVTEDVKKEEENARTIADALKKAQRADAQKTAFFGNVSHDLRTPLNAILGYDDLALDIEGLPDQAVDYLLKIGKAGKAMLALVNDTLDLQRMEAGKLDLVPERISAEKLVARLNEIAVPMMTAKALAFTLDSSKLEKNIIIVDRMRLRQVVVNLLSNAVKYTNPGGEVTITLETVAVRRNHALTTIRIKDNGSGMSKEFMENGLFEPFAQERMGDTAGIGGSGLGLSVVKQLVEVMGGTISVKSFLGKGTEFTLIFDFELAEDESVENPEEGNKSKRGLDGLRFLLCEDNDMNAEISKLILARAGALKVDVAKDGQEGLNMFLASEPGYYSLILMDIRMPVMDGYKSTREIRASTHPDADRIPILALSADAYQSDVEKALASGMNGHIAKPMNPEETINRIRKLVSTAH